MTFHFGDDDWEDDDEEWEDDDEEEEDDDEDEDERWRRGIPGRSS